MLRPAVKHMNSVVTSASHTRLRARNGWLVALIALCVILHLPPASAGEVPWRKGVIERVYEQKDLRELLRDLASSQGVVAVVDDEISAKVSGKFNLPAANLFQWLVTTYGLAHFYTGNVLFITPSNNVTTELLRLKHLTPEAFMRILDDMRLTERRFPISMNERERMLVVSGPKQYVEMIKRISKSADENEGGRAATQVRVFALKYAWAGDYVFRQGGREYVVPGVATVLQRLFNAQPGPAEPSEMSRGLATAVKQEPVTQRVKGTDLTLKLPPRLPKPEELLQAVEAGQEGNAAESLPKQAQTPGRVPQFQADGRRNAVLVLDVPERMAVYEEVIRELDVRPMLVEIEASIIEVGSDDLKALGIDWRLTTSSVDLRSGRGDLPTQRFNGKLPSVDGPVNTAPIGGALTSAGGVFTSILTDAGRSLVTRINALAQDGKATFRANPKVTTLDNVEAVLERLSTFFVRVPGSFRTDLFDVSAGTSMRVTPLVVDEPNERQIKLSIKIEDGDITDQRVDQIPVVTRNSIGTQAFVTEGQSLLIAGFTSETKREIETGVPGLSKLPVVGALFRNRETHGTRAERLFLITPRLVPLGPPPAS